MFSNDLTPFHAHRSFFFFSFLTFSRREKVQVLFHPLPYGTRPVKIAVTLEKDNTVLDLKTTICKRYNAEMANVK